MHQLSSCATTEARFRLSAIAIKDYITEKKTPFIISGFAVAEALTMEKVSPYLFRIT